MGLRKAAVGRAEMFTRGNQLKDRWLLARSCVELTGVIAEARLSGVPSPMRAAAGGHASSGFGVKVLAAPRITDAVAMAADAVEAEIALISYLWAAAGGPETRPSQLRALAGNISQGRSGSVG